MKDCADEPYPGDNATASEVGLLADEYNLASRELRGKCRKGKKLSYFPARLCALHAMELYLQAFLRERGVSAREIRSLNKNHELSQLLRLAEERGLKLKKRRHRCLERVTGNREYLIQRYAPDTPLSLEPINGIEAALQDIADSVRAAVKWKRAPQGALQTRTSADDHSAG